MGSIQDHFARRIKLRLRTTRRECKGEYRKTAAGEVRVGSSVFPRHLDPIDQRCALKFAVLEPHYYAVRSDKSGRGINGDLERPGKHTFLIESHSICVDAFVGKDPCDGRWRLA